MAATKEDINRWINEGKEMGATHLISVCDTYAWEYHPVYVMPDQDLTEQIAKYNGLNMQRIDEVINIS